MTLLAQAGFGTEKSAAISLQQKVIEKLDSLKEDRLWVRYRIARQTARLVRFYYF